MKNKLKIFGVLISLIIVVITIKFLFFSSREIMFHDAIIYGKVKSIKEISYKAKLKNGEIIKVKRWRIGHLTDDFHCFFNEHGLPIKEIIYPAADTGTVSKIYYFKYNRIGQLIKYYNLATNQIKIEYYYSKNGKLIKEKTNTNIIRYEYYPNGQLKHKIYVDPKNGDEFIDTYAYKNNFIKYLDGYYIVADWHLIDEYERDHHGNIIKYRMASSFEELKKEKWDEFEYEFDWHNNWIKCIHYRNKKPIYIIEREIEYY